MLNLKKLFKKKPKPAPASNMTPQSDLKEGWHKPMTAKQLLDTPYRQKQLHTIWQNISMTPDSFRKLYREPIEKFAELVQLLPASESHHHSHLGGMLDHVLEVVAIASKLRQNYILPPNAPPEEQAKQKDVWTAVMIYGSLLHDLGKVLVDINVMLDNGEKWQLFNGNIDRPYRFFYVKDRDYELHPCLGSVLLNLIIPPMAISWIATYPKPFASLMYYITNHSSKSGLVSEIIQKADQFSVTMALGGDIQKIQHNTQVSFAQQLKIALIDVVKKAKLNATQGGASGYLTEDGLFMMSKSTADAIRAYLIAQGVSVPANNGKLFDELQAHHLIETTPEQTAVWHCKIASHSGWCPDNLFTLLRISPALIWEEFSERPDLFNGFVTPTTQVKEESSEKNNEVTQDGEHNTAPVLNISEATESEPVNLNVLFPAENTENTDIQPKDIQEERTAVTLSENDDQASDDLTNATLSLFDIAQHNLVEKEELPVSKPVVSKNSEIPDVLQNQGKIRRASKNFSPIKTTATGTKSPNEQVFIDKALLDEFILWIKQGTASKKISINDAKAPLHMVNDHLFLVSPTIFKRFLGQKGDDVSLKACDALQKDFQRLGLHKKFHKKDGDSLNLWRCSVIGSKRKSVLNGYLLENSAYLLGDRIIPNNYHLTLLGEANDHDL